MYFFKQATCTLALGISISMSVVKQTMPEESLETQLLFLCQCGKKCFFVHEICVYLYNANLICLPKELFYLIYFFFDLCLLFSFCLFVCFNFDFEFYALYLQSNSYCPVFTTVTKYYCISAETLFLAFILFQDNLVKKYSS